MRRRVLARIAGAFFAAAAVVVACSNDPSTPASAADAGAADVVVDQSTPPEDDAAAPADAGAEASGPNDASTDVDAAPEGDGGIIFTPFDPIDGGPLTVLHAASSDCTEIKDGLAVDADGIYYGEGSIVVGTSETNVLRRIPLAGGASTVLARNVECRTLALSPTSAFCRSFDRTSLVEIAKTQTDGGAGTTLLSAGPHGFGELAYANGTLVYDDFTSQTWRTLAGAELGINGREDRRSVALDGATAFFFSFAGNGGGKILSRPYDASTPAVTVAEVPYARFGAIGVFGNEVFWTENHEGRGFALYAAPKAGGARRLLHATAGFERANDLVVNAGGVWISARKSEPNLEGRFVHVPRGGGSMSSFGGPVWAPRGIARFGNDVYVSWRGGGSGALAGCGVARVGP